MGATINTSKRPNFLLIVADDLGFSDLGLYISSLSAILSTKPFKEELDSPTIDQQGGIIASSSGGSLLDCWLIFMLLVGLAEDVL